VSTAATAIIAAVVGALASLAGVIIGGRITLRIEREQATSAARSELAAALARYMAACDLVSTEISSLPARSWIERQLDRIPNRRIGWAAQRLLARIVIGDRWEKLQDRYWDAYAGVVLLAPTNVISIALRVEDLFAAWEHDRAPGAEWARQWVELQQELRLTAQMTADDGLGRPYRAGERQLVPPRPLNSRRRDEEAPIPLLVKDFAAFLRERRRTDAT
jgi:hypothetical protein